MGVRIDGAKRPAPVHRRAMGLGVVRHHARGPRPWSSAPACSVGWWRDRRSFLGLVPARRGAIRRVPSVGHQPARTRAGSSASGIGGSPGSSRCLAASSPTKDRRPRGDLGSPPGRTRKRRPRPGGGGSCRGRSRPRAAIPAAAEDVAMPRPPTRRWRSRVR